MNDLSKSDDLVVVESGSGPRASGQAKKAAQERYPFRGCVICGVQLDASLTIAHLDHRSGNNDPDNLAYLCWTHHRMFDAGLYPLNGIKLLRAHWQSTMGKPNYKAVMKDAGAKAAITRVRSRSAKKAWITRRITFVEPRSAKADVVD